eukprot:CAMPEP_0182877878 /NCGR_PEP_ID=MMETSP0034_2-20130328/15023_1 /TAXON_ID=156128 /ORGANISM="Nephroselmis pyriformis, Strain CCMP717" /LENGTH=215 /DNA_ID=CAMNT_0025010743 /DNA_START=95 /DNA_END=739 /DNA_ORIENTATION=-
MPRSLEQLLVEPGRLMILNPFPVLDSRVSSRDQVSPDDPALVDAMCCWLGSEDRRAANHILRIHTVAHIIPFPMARMSGDAIALDEFFPPDGEENQASELGKFGKLSLAVMEELACGVQAPARELEGVIFLDSSRVSRGLQRRVMGAINDARVAKGLPAVVQFKSSALPRCKTTVTCSACGTVVLERALGVCSRCEAARYCSKACQKAHWKEHKK